MPHENHHTNHLLHWLQLSAVAAAGATIAAPYVLPMLGKGTVLDTASVASMCGDTVGGLTQSVEKLLGGVPGIGGTLASAGWGSSVIAAGIGIGGMMLGDYVHRHYDRKGHIPWGKVIKYATLATSMLIALPSILSGISMGITFLALVFNGPEAMFTARGVLQHTIGFSGVAHSAPTGLAALTPHLFTCGRALLPLGAAAIFSPRNQPSADGANYSARLVTTPLVLPGQPCRLDFQLVDAASGRVLDASELKTVHTKKLHTMIVDSTLSDYQHLHPTYDAAHKCFTCQFTPKLQGSYRMWNELTLKGESTPIHLEEALPSPRSFNLRPRIDCRSQVEAGDLRFTIATNGPLRANEDAILTVTVTGNNGQPVRDLEPIMGAYAHLAGFSSDGQHFIHSHPLSAEPSNEAERGASPLQFHIHPEMAGSTKFFLQIQRKGNVLTVPFGQIVAPNQSHSVRLEHRHPDLGAARVA